MMEKYANNLENTITDRMRQLTEETKKADILLYKFLPRYVSIAGLPVLWVGVCA